MSRKLQAVAVIEILLIFIVLSISLPTSEKDVATYYAPIGAGCVTCGHTPYTAVFVLWPLNLIPVSALWSVWTVITVLIIWWACWQLGTNPIYVLISIAMLSQFWIGQVDALILFGLVLAITSKNAYVRGAGLLIASVKPQISLVAMALVLWHDRERLKLLIVPGLALAVSFIIWGLDWPVHWLSTGIHTPSHPWKANLYPWALPVLLIVPFVKDKRQQITVALWCSALAMPSFAAYSHIVPLAFFAPWWSVLAGLLWLLTVPITIWLFPVWLPWLLAIIMLFVLIHRNFTPLTRLAFLPHWLYR